MFLPLAVVGLVVSLASLIVQEELVPLANDRAAYLRESAIEHLSPAASNLTGGHVVARRRQTGDDCGRPRCGDADAAQRRPCCATMPKQTLEEMIVSERARYEPPTWTFQNATTYQFTRRRRERHDGIAER